MNLLPKGKIIHYPDLHFINYCTNNYNINRGVYNVIDIWFFEKNYSNVIERRKVIIDFLTYINRENVNEQSKKFGKGGLTESLKEFWEKADFKYLDVN